MEEVATSSRSKPPVKPWLKQRWLLIAISVLLVTAVWGGYKIYKDLTMPPPLVFLIPDDYFGPVFFFFGQPDGVDVQPDPLGQAVTVPANGVLKIKSKVDDVMGDSKEGYRSTYMIVVNKNGQRKTLIMHGDSRQNDKNEWFTFYFDENSKLYQIPTATAIGKSRFYYFTDQQRNQKMVFEHGGCAHQEFYPTGGVNVKAPACGKFLLVSPNQYLKLPDFMWEEFAHPFSSIDDLIKQANEALAQKKAFYKLP